MESRDVPLSIQHLDFVVGMLELLHSVESPRVPQAHGQAGFGMRDFDLHLPDAVPGVDPRRAWKGRVKGQQAAGLQMVATRLQRGELIVGRQVMHERVERNHDQRVTSGEPEPGHVCLVQTRVDSECRRFLQQSLQHSWKQIEPLHIRAGLQTRQQDPAGAAPHVEDRAARRSRQSQIEFEAKIEALEDEVVKVAIIEGGGVDGVWERSGCGGLSVGLVHFEGSDAGVAAGSQPNWCCMPKRSMLT